MSPLTDAERAKLYEKYKVTHPETGPEEHPINKVNRLWQEDNNQLESSSMIIRLWTSLLAWLKSKNIEL